MHRHVNWACYQVIMFIDNFIIDLIYTLKIIHVHSASTYDIYTHCMYTSNRCSVIKNIGISLFTSSLHCQFLYISCRSCVCVSCLLCCVFCCYNSWCIRYKKQKKKSSIYTLRYVLLFQLHWLLLLFWH